MIVPIHDTIEILYYVAWGYYKKKYVFSRAVGACKMGQAKYNNMKSLYFLQWQITQDIELKKLKEMYICIANSVKITTKQQNCYTCMQRNVLSKQKKNCSRNPIS